ncbi:MAG TPA: metallophosphoesterase [Gemmatimonadales bacterium]|nr:metallophosphoesterase [Gemmatimonadales bacterium]
MTVTLVHCSDLHFGRDADLRQLDALVALVPSLQPTAILVAGDLTQRARHGEFQAALALFGRLEAHAPLLTVAGNHDVEWWRSPFHVLGTRRLYAKWRRYFGEDLTPVLRLPGVTVATALSAYGVAAGSLTWNPNDMAVKGHLPTSEVERLARVFAATPPEDARVVMLHHNVLRGNISRRMGLAHWGRAQRQLLELGADLLVYGHDHEEAAAQLGGRVAVSASSTHTRRTRGQRPSAFNVVDIEAAAITIRHWRWDAAAGRFGGSDRFTFARAPRAAAREAVAARG